MKMWRSLHVLSGPMVNSGNFNITLYLLIQIPVMDTTLQAQALFRCIN